MKNNLAKLLGGAVLGLTLLVSPASALAIDTWHIDTDRGGISNVPYNIDDPATGQTHVMVFDVGSGYQQWFNPARFKSEFLDVYYGFIATTTYDADMAAILATNTNQQSQINFLLSGGSSFNVSTFMANQASTTPFVASSTSNGFMSSSMVSKLNGLSTSTASTTANGLMSATDKAKLDSLSTSTPTVSYTNRSLNSCFQVSATKDAFVAYSVDVDTTITLSGGANGQVTLRTYSDSGCTTDGQTIQRGKAGLTGTVIVGVAMSNPGSVSLGGIVTRGRYAKLETSNLTGTPTYTMAATQEVTGSLVQ